MRPYAAAVVIAFGGVMASLCAFLVVLTWEHRASELAFQNTARSFLDTIDAELHSSNAILTTVGTYIETNDHQVSSEQFARFVSVLHGRVVGLRNIAWAPRVSLAERWRFEHGGFPGVGPHGYRLIERDAQHRFVRARLRPVSYPILYLQTSLENQAAEMRRVRGYDLNSEANRAAAIARALRTGQPAATSPVSLITVRGRSGGVIAFMPVRRSRGGVNPAGVVFAVFDISVMVDNIVTKRTPHNGLDLYLFEPNRRPDRRFIYWRPSTSALGRPPAEAALASTMHWRGTLTMVDQTWGAIVTPSVQPSWFDESWQAVAALVTGLLMTALMVMAYLASVRRTLLLERMTTSLQKTTEDLQRNVEQVAHLARHDALTGLPNRTLFRERMSEALARSRRGSPFAIMYLDLDHFKSVNDTLGHDVGDQLLCAVAARITNCLRDFDTIARLGGDEFAIILAGESQIDRIAPIADRLVREVARPYDIGAHRVEVGVSIGIATDALGATTEITLLKDADGALYEAKAAGRGTYRFSRQQHGLTGGRA